MVAASEFSPIGMHKMYGLFDVVTDQGTAEQWLNTYLTRKFVAPYSVVFLLVQRTHKPVALFFFLLQSIGINRTNRPVPYKKCEALFEM